MPLHCKVGTISAKMVEMVGFGPKVREIEALYFSVDHSPAYDVAGYYLGYVFLWGCTLIGIKSLD
jgi:hypothetical protein